jgi:hypothetical protein
MSNRVTLAVALLSGAALSGACAHDGSADSARDGEADAVAGAAGTSGADSVRDDGATGAAIGDAASETDDGVATDDATSAAGTSTLSADEVRALRFMREEEKLARDVYLLNVDALQVFANIRGSEERHMDAMLTLLQAYGIEDPIADRTPGRFLDPDLQELYDALAARSSQSLEEALRVGAEIEEIDIRDLQQAIAQTQREDIAAVYANLQRASRNHLRAFTRNLAMRGIEYAPQHLSAEAYQQILDSPRE